MKSDNQINGMLSNLIGNKSLSMSLKRPNSPGSIEKSPLKGPFSSNQPSQDIESPYNLSRSRNSYIKNIGLREEAKSPSIFNKDYSSHSLKPKEQAIDFLSSRRSSHNIEPESASSAKLSSHNEMLLKEKNRIQSMTVRLESKAEERRKNLHSLYDQMRFTNKRDQESSHTKFSKFGVTSPLLQGNERSQDSKDYVNDELREKLVKIEEINDQLAKEKDNLQKKLVEQKEKEDELDKKCKIYEGMIQELESQIDILSQSQDDETTHQILQIEQEFSNFKLMHEKLEIDFMSKCRDLQQLNQELETLKTQNSDLQKKLKEVTNELKSSLHHNSNAQLSDRKTQETKDSDLNLKIRILNEQLKQKDKTLRNSEGELKTLLGKLKTSEEKVKVIEAGSSRTAAKLKSTEDKLEKVLAELAARDEELDLLKSKTQAENSQSDVIYNKLKNLEIQYKENNLILVSKEEELDALTVKFENEKVKSKDLQSKLKSTEAQLKSVQFELTQKDEELELSRNKLQEESNRYTSAQTKLKNAEQKLKDLTTKISETEEKFDDLTNKLQADKSRYDTAQNRIKSLEAQLERVRVDIVNKDQELEILQDENNRFAGLQSRLKNSEVQFKNISMELTEKQKELDSLKVSLQEDKNHINSNEIQIQELTTHLEEAQFELINKNNEISGLLSKVQRIEDENTELENRLKKMETQKSDVAINSTEKEPDSGKAILKPSRFKPQESRNRVSSRSLETLPESFYLEIAAKDDEIKSLKEHIENLNTNLDNIILLEAQKKETDAAKEKVQFLLKRHEQEINLLQKKNIKLASKLEFEEQMNKDFKVKTQNLEQKIKEYANTFEILIKQYENEKLVLVQSSRQMQDEYQLLSERFDSLKDPTFKNQVLENSTSSESQKEQKWVETQAVEHEKSLLNQQIQLLERDLQDKVRQIREGESKNRVLQDKVEELEVSYSALEKENIELKQNQEKLTLTLTQKSEEASPTNTMKISSIMLNSSEPASRQFLAGNMQLIGKDDEIDGFAQLDNKLNLEPLREEINKLTEDKENLAEKLKTFSLIIDDKDDHLLQKVKECRELSEKIRSHESTIQNLRRRIDRITADNETQEDQLIKYRLEIATLKTELEKQASQTLNPKEQDGNEQKDLEKSTQAHNTDITMNNESRLQNSPEAELKNQELKELKEQYDALVEKIGKLSEQCNSEVVEHEKTKSALKISGEKREVLENELKLAREQIQSPNKYKSSLELESRISSKEEEIQVLRLENESFRQRNEALQIQITTLKEQINHVNKDLSEQRELAQQKDNDASTAMAKEQALRLSYNSLSKQMEAIKVENTQLTQNNSVLSVENQGLVDKNTYLSTKQNDLEKEITSKTAEAQEFQAAQINIKEEISKLKLENENLQSKVSLYEDGIKSVASGHITDEDYETPRLGSKQTLELLSKQDEIRKLGIIQLRSYALEQYLKANSLNEQYEESKKELNRSQDSIKILQESLKSSAIKLEEKIASIKKEADNIVFMERAHHNKVEEYIYVNLAEMLKEASTTRKVKLFSQAELEDLRNLIPEIKRVFYECLDNPSPLIKKKTNQYEMELKEEITKLKSKCSNQELEINKLEEEIKLYEDEQIKIEEVFKHAKKTRTVLLPVNREHLIEALIENNRMKPLANDSEFIRHALIYHSFLNEVVFSLPEVVYPTSNKSFESTPSIFQQKSEKELEIVRKELVEAENEKQKLSKSWATVFSKFDKKLQAILASSGYLQYYSTLLHKDIEKETSSSPLSFADKVGYKIEALEKLALEFNELRKINNK